ncbi:hypothetical protein GH714_003059 [Hevea brasiliensis]|uniref:Uncharacterized protein n=1 Tax=Hevea brasiliensis TaxID=3981 RepID=A0A6A6LEA5_HEVBR|nr:hypothetical protein GH714_003059 [Hevea brasiliensis]
MIKEARAMADSNKLDDARDKLVEAQNSLEDVDDESKPMIGDAERFAQEVMWKACDYFSTPRMDKYLEQAKSFDEDPSKPLPSVDDDVKEELAANPLAPIAGALSFYIQSAIQSLQAIEKIINRGIDHWLFLICACFTFR